jgi:hypothetical protein
MNFANSSYNRRQLVLMERVIQEFEERSRSLWQLVQDLEALFACLQSPDPQWSEQFQLGWATLEEVNAVLLHQGGRVANEETEALVRITADELLAIVKTALASSSEREVD